MLDALEEPMVIEQHDVKAHVRVPRDFERGIHIDEEAVIEPRGEPAIVVDDAGAAVAEDEPARDGEAEARDLVEVARNRLAPRRDAEMRPPDVPAEVEPVEHRLAVRGPRVIDAVDEIKAQGSKLNVHSRWHSGVRYEQSCRLS